jgi:hypothetical protein
MENRMLTRKSTHDVDDLARNLAAWAAMGARMPPAYERHGIREPLVSQDGTHLGHVLDGKGIYLDCDLKDLGIKGRIPHVYERSLTNRILDKLGREDGAITSYDNIIAQRAGGFGNDVMVAKSSYVTVASNWSTSFRAGGSPVAGTYSNIPGGAAPDNTNVGALSLGLSNPTGGNSKYMLVLGSMATQQLNMVMLVDLLVAAGNIVATSNSPQTVNSTALTRYTTGAGVYMTFDVTTVQGATAQNITVSYTNQASASGQSTGAVAMTASAIVQRLQPAALGQFIGLASGDTGVQSVQTVTFSAANTQGAVALNLYKPVIWMPGLTAAVYGENDTTTTIDGLFQLATASGVLGCLTVYVFCSTTSTGLHTMTLRTVAG